jgi:hypothetical protein
MVLIYCTNGTVGVTPFQASLIFASITGVLTYTGTKEKLRGMIIQKEVVCSLLCVC